MDGIDDETLPTGMKAPPQTSKFLKQDLAMRLLAFCKKEKVLFLAIFFAFGLSLIGINWGSFEEWNPDQMAFRSVPNNLMVADYLKPPLDTYVNRLLVLNPVDIVMKGILHSPETLHLRIRLLGVRLLTLVQFCAAITILYFGILRFSGRRAAATLSLIMGTSAGMIAFNHYGTADTPLVFWMLLAFYTSLVAAETRCSSWAFAAGLLTGLAAGCKYNGLLVGASIPVAFLVAGGGGNLLKRGFWIACLAAPVGFVMAVPGSVFDHHRFVRDFLYNLYTTPVYSGDASGPGFFRFLLGLSEIVGWPCLLLLAISCLISAVLLVSGKLGKSEKMLFLASLSVFLVYLVVVGRFPRMENRFILPAAPFVMMCAAPAVSRANVGLLGPLMAILVAYNVFCSWLTGNRYADEPRMRAIAWASANMESGSLVENAHPHTPSWDHVVKGVSVSNIETPTGREERFKKILGDNKVVLEGVKDFDRDTGNEVFTKQALDSRHPDYVAFSTFAIAFSGAPISRQYYEDHLEQKLGYRIVFDVISREVPVWSYPQHLDFVPDRMTILKKSEPHPSLR